MQQTKLKRLKGLIQKGLPKQDAYLKHTNLSKTLQVHLAPCAIIFFPTHSGYSPYPHTIFLIYFYLFDMDEIIFLKATPAIIVLKRMQTISGFIKAHINTFL